MKYEIDPKALFVRIAIVLLIGALIAGAFFWLKKGKNEDKGETKVYDVLVQIKDQTNPNPEEDLRSSLKAGDAVLLRETGKQWSRIEEISYLILKIKLSQSQAQKLIEPETVELSEEEALAQGMLNEEMKKELPKEELEQILKKETRARKYRVKIEELEFDPEKIKEAQPFADREFDWKIVEEKKKLKK